MRWLTVLSGALVTGAALSAQAQGVVRGKVTDVATGRPISGATVTISGTTLSSGTNDAGEYSIASVTSGPHEVIARRIGYARGTQTVTVSTGADVTADFAMRISAATLDAVVVTGTAGDAEKRTLGNSITQIDAAELTAKTTVTNVSEILQSKTPGVSVLPGSGAPGTAGELRIRGASSMAGYRPIILIDGIRFNSDTLGGFSATGGGTAGLAQSTQVTSALNNLNPNDIESIEVIKGPAAATLYGADASNGVIQIITKKGVRGTQPLRWGFRVESGKTEWTELPPDNLKTCDAAAQAATISSTDTRPLWPGCQGVPVNTIIRDNPLVNWRDASGNAAYRTGDLLKYSGNVRGGGDRYSYYVAGDRNIEEGVFLNSDENRTSLRANFGFNPTEKADFQVNFNWQDGRLRLPIQDESANGLLLSSTRGDAGRVSRFSDTTAKGWKTIAPNQANKYQNYQSAERMTLGGTINYTPIKWFQNRLTAGFDNTVTQAQLLFLPGDIDASQDADAASGANFRSTPTRSLLSIDYAGSLLFNRGADVTTTTRFGTQVVSDRSETVQARGVGIGAVDVTRVDLLTRTTGLEGFSENNSVGYYIQEQVGWKNRLFLTGALRADDHSAFGTNFDWIVYPKFSASWVVSEEPAASGLLDRAGITSLKLRTAWGQAGRAPTAYSAVQTYTIDRVTLGTNTGSALRTSSIGNPDLKPERGEEIELGFDLGMLRDRVGVDFTFYNKKTEDMLQSVLMPASTGFNSSRILNLGSVLNRGFEIALTGTPLQKVNVGWDTRLNFSTNRNELLSFDVPGKEVDNPTGQAYGTVQQHRVGYPLGGYWVTPPVRDANGAAVLTQTGAATFNPGDTARRYIGPSTPTREVGFSNSFRFGRSFGLYALMDYKGGGFIFNQMERSRCQAANDNCERVNDPAARFPGPTALDSVKFKELAVYRSTSISPEFIMPTDFLKLREVTLSYDVPTRFAARARATSARLALTGRNLHTIWTKYEGVDPEVNSYGGRNFVRVDAYAAPPMRRLAMSLSLTY
jgi:TonB-dependent starch-binding outer membrane protein SusC